MDVAVHAVSAPSVHNPLSKGRNALPAPNVLNAPPAPNAARAQNVSLANGLPDLWTAFRRPSQPANLASSNSRVRRSQSMTRWLQMSLLKPIPSLQLLQRLKLLTAKPAAAVAAAVGDANAARTRIKPAHRLQRLQSKPRAQLSQI